MASREECLFDPLSGGLFDHDDDDDSTKSTVFGSTPASGQIKSASLFDDDDEETPPSAPASSSSGLFDDEDEGAFAKPALPVTTAGTTTDTTTDTIVSENEPSDLLAQVDLSKISVVQKIDHSSKKKKKKAKAIAAAAVAKKSKNHGLLGADDDEFDLTLRPKVEEDTLDAFLLRGEEKGDEEETSAPGLFDSDGSDDDGGADSSRSTKQTGGKSTGAYVKRMLTEDKPDDFDTNIADLSVAKMLTTEADTAGGLIEAGDGAKNVRTAAALAERTSDDLLHVANDDDLTELMAVTKVSGSIEESAPEGSDDLFNVEQNDDTIDDDLFSMMGIGGGDAENSADGAGASDMSSIDAYISAQSGAGASLFD